MSHPQNHAADGHDASNGHSPSVGQRLRALRLESGLTQSELASRLQTTQSAVARLESGHRRTSLEVLERVARALDCELAVVIARKRSA